MALKATLSASLLLAALLAGCSEAPPTGTVSDLSFAPTVAGTVDIQYQPFEGANPGSDLPVVNGTVQCAQGQVPNSPVPPCRGPWTAVVANVTLPLPGEGEYATVSLYWVNATGEAKLADLTEASRSGNEATFTGELNVSQDMAGQYTSVVLRMGPFTLATAPAEEGPQMLSLVQVRPTVTATFTGMQLNGTVSGLPANATYRGNLYLPDESGQAAAEPSESFDIRGDGAFTHTSGRNISEFKEFHIHVDHSKLNLYKATIQVAEE